LTVAVYSRGHFKKPSNGHIPLHKLTWDVRNFLETYSSLRKFRTCRRLVLHFADMSPTLSRGNSRTISKLPWDKSRTSRDKSMQPQGLLYQLNSTPCDVGIWQDRRQQRQISCCQQLGIYYMLLWVWRCCNFNSQQALSFCVGEEVFVTEGKTRLLQYTATWTQRVSAHSMPPKVHLSCLSCPLQIPLHELADLSQTSLKHHNEL